MFSSESGLADGFMSSLSLGSPSRPRISLFDDNGRVAEVPEPSLGNGERVLAQFETDVGMPRDDQSQPPTQHYLPSPDDEEDIDMHDAPRRRGGSGGSGGSDVSMNSDVSNGGGANLSGAFGSGHHRLGGPLAPTDSQSSSTASPNELFGGLGSMLGPRRNAHHDDTDHPAGPAGPQSHLHLHQHNAYLHLNQNGYDGPLGLLHQDGGVGGAANNYHGYSAEGGVPPPYDERTRFWNWLLFVLPDAIYRWARAIFFLCVLGCLASGVVFVAWGVYTDVKSRAGERAEQLREEIVNCARNYNENHCEPARRLPAMQTKCTEWEICKRQDPGEIIASFKVIMEIVGEAVNTFFATLEWRTIGGLPLLLLGCLCACSVFMIVAKVAGVARGDGHAEDNHNVGAYQAAQRARMLPDHFREPTFVNRALALGAGEGGTGEMVRRRDMGTRANGGGYEDE